MDVVYAVSVTQYPIVLFYGLGYIIVTVLGMLLRSSNASPEDVEKNFIYDFGAMVSIFFITLLLYIFSYTIYFDCKSTTHCEVSVTKPQTTKQIVHVGLFSKGK